LDGADGGGRIDADGENVNELDVWERDSDFDELGSTEAGVDDEVATPEELVGTELELVGMELVGMAGTDSVVRMVIVKGPGNVKPPPSPPSS